MHDAAARSLRTAERYLLLPPLPALFGGAPVHLCDISSGGARFRTDEPIPSGTKNTLRAAATDRVTPLAMEAVVVWCQPDSASAGKFVCGIRALAAAEVMGALLRQLHETQRTSRIEELRSADRFVISPLLEAQFDERRAFVVDLSARGARVEVGEEPRSESGMLSLTPATGSDRFEAEASVAWSALRSIAADGQRVWRAGLRIDGMTDQLRLVIARLAAMKRAALDTNSLHLKLRILRAQARELGIVPSGDHGLDPGQLLLIRGVREELRLNPEEALVWYRRARLVIADPLTRGLAPQIADRPDAIAVWEYLDRSIDASIVSRAFELLNLPEF